MEKLIRDKVPSLLTEEDRPYQLTKLDAASYKEALIHKLIEETQEFVQSGKMEELADILEVIHALLKNQQTTFEELEALRLAKREERGGFEEGILLKKGISSKENCLFCTLPKERVVANYTHCFVIEDRFPVSRGHLLIIPHSHYTDWFDAPKNVQLEMIDVLNSMKLKNDATYAPQGYNIGMNCGKTAGQTVMHLHMHLIPRYHGDMADPKGGVRGVIPEKQKY
jgi:diadenosine tetraphosphate (Ap4A) HIT family hydrolase/predicted house-cleaning noncanonical NTP pyrophosphatase (MazG superfamily)